MINEHKTYLSPKEVFLPLTDPSYKIANMKVEEGDQVLVGAVLGYKYKGQDKLPIISSVSGKVVGYQELMDRFGKIVDHIVIENDGLNNHVEVKQLEEPTASEIRARLEEFGLYHINVDGIYTPLSFEKPIQHVVVNVAFTNTPFLKTDYLAVHDHAEEIAQGIELLKKAANAETATVIADKEMEPFAFNSLGEAVVDKDITLETVKFGKVAGKEFSVLQKLIKRPVSINPLEDGILYVKEDTAQMVYDAVVKGQAPTSRQVTFSGDGIKENVVYTVTIGTKLDAIIDDLGGYNEVDEMVLHYGNFLTGNQLTTDETSISLNVDTINIQEFHEMEEEVCTKCGECNDVCPAGILPQNIMDAEIRSVNERIVDLDTKACIECGLCTYTCPSNINVLEWVRRAKRRVG